MQRILAIIPTYNERENIAELIARLHALYGERVEILVVDDSSPDGTAEVVRQMQEQFPHVHLLTRPHKSGIAGAYLEAFTHAQENGYDIVVQMDADFSHDPAHIQDMIDQLEAHDVVIGSRYVDGGGVQDWPWHRRMISRLGSWYARMVLQKPIRDFTGGFTAWRTHVFTTIGLNRIRSRGYSFQIEMKYRAASHGHRITEVPITFADRTQGKSKMSKRIVFEAIWRLWMIRGRRVAEQISRCVRERPIRCWYLLVLILLAGFVSFWNLGAGAIENWDEGIYAIVSHEMLEQPSLTLQLHGQPWFEKPPLGFWIEAGSMALFGVTEFAVRLPSAIYFFISILLIYFLGKALFDEHIAFVSAILTAITPAMLHEHMARTGDLDTGLLLLTVAALYFLVKAVGQHRPGMLIASGAMVGLLVMLRGTPAVFVLLIGLVYFIVTGAWRAFAFKVYGYTILVLLGIALPWHIHQLWVHGQQFWNVYVMEHFLSRISMPIQTHGGPWYFYVEYFWDRQGIIFSVLVIVALLYALYRLWTAKRHTLWLPLIWMIVIIVPLMIMQTKLHWYAITLIPPMMYVVAYTVVDFVRRGWNERHWWQRSAATLSLAAVLYSGGMFVAHTYQYVLQSNTSSIQQLALSLPSDAQQVVVHGVQQWYRGYILPESTWYFQYQHDVEPILVGPTNLNHYVVRSQYQYFVTDQDHLQDLEGAANGRYRFVEFTRHEDMAIYKKESHN